MTEQNNELTEILNIDGTEEIIDNMEKIDWDEIKEENENEDFNNIVITDENYKRIQKMISKKYYEKHSDAILTRSLMYYENNKAKVLAIRKEKYNVIKREKAQEKYNKDYEKYLSTVQECRNCGNEKQALCIFCDECIIKKYGDNVVF